MVESLDREVLEQRSRAFDLVFDAVVVTDLEGVITDWNTGAERLYGYRREEAVGQHVSILHALEETETRTDEVLEGIARDGRWTGEIRLRRADGSMGWIESIVVPVLDEGGQTVGALGINRDITERVQDQQELERLARVDPLTGLANRAEFFRCLEAAIARGRRTGDIVGVLFVDLDDFKAINDRGGHSAGDAVLIELAQRMERELRQTDTLGRLGGDEFGIVLDPLGTRDDAANVARKLIDAVGESIAVADQLFRVGVSVGIALFPQHGTETDSLVSAADMAMYACKDGDEQWRWAQGESELREIRS